MILFCFLGEHSETSLSIYLSLSSLPLSLSSVTLIYYISHSSTHSLSKRNYSSDIFPSFCFTFFCFSKKVYSFLFSLPLSLTFFLTFSLSLFLSFSLSLFLSSILFLASFFFPSLHCLQLHTYIVIQA